MSVRWAVAAGVAIALTPAPALAAPGWTGPLELGAGATEPAVGAAGNGGVTVAWTSGDDQVLGAQRPPGGAFGAPVQLSALGAEAAAPSVAVNAAGAVAAAWVSDGAVETATGLAPAGAVPDPGADPSEVQAGVDGTGRQWFAWLHEEASGSRVRVARRDPGGALTMVGDVSAVGAGELSLAVGESGAAYATWVLTTEAGGGDITRTRVQQADLVAGGPAGTIAEGELEVVGGDDVGDVLASPQAAVTTDGQLLLGWLREVLVAGVDPVTEVRSNAASGAVASTAASILTLDAAAGSAGVGVLAWDELVSAAATTVRAAVRPSGGALGAPATLATGGVGSAVGDPRAAVRAGGETVVSWTREGGRIEASAGGGPGAEVTASGADGAALLSPDGEGNVVAAWEHDPSPAPGDDRIRVAAYDAAGPSLSGFSAPSRVEVGDTAPFGVTALDTWSGVSALDWTFGDGGTASGAEVTHVYGSTGQFPAAVTGRDALGNTSTTGATVAVGEAPAPPPPPPAAVPADVTPPSLTGLRPVSRCVRSRAPSFALTLSEAASVRFILRRRAGSPGRRRCPPARGKRPGTATPVGDRTVDLPSGGSVYAVGTRARAVRRLRKGRTVVRVLTQSRLRPGTYQLIARATDAAGNRAPDVITKVWVLRR